MSSSSKYRGAVVEDLQLAPAFCLPATATLSQALEAAYEREFDQLPVLNEQRRPIGYLDVKLLKRKFEQGKADPNDPIRKHTTLFRPFTSASSSSSSSTTYEIIHPLTPLQDLEAFFDRQSVLAADRNARRHPRGDKESTPTPTGLGQGFDDEAEGAGHEFALVTDLARKWVLAVATRNDLETFVKRRGGHQDESFEWYSGELQRRKRKADYKRRQHGQSFLDHLVVTVRGGTGGSGAAAFVPMKSSSVGPPSGGNGGAGGDIYFETSSHVTSLAAVPKRIRAGNGLNGQGSYRHGKRGADTVVRLPVGTVIKEISRESEAEKIARDEAALEMDDEERRRVRRARMFIKHPMGEITEDDYLYAERLLAKEQRALNLHEAAQARDKIHIDIDRPLDQPLLITRGGTGGLGNPHFIDPAQPHRAARLASRGATPSTITLALELKLIADVGLVGFPNAGKSTILRALTGRRAEVADYSFTTLNPQVGVVRVMDDGTWQSDVGVGKVIDETWRERQREHETDERRAKVATAAGGAAADTIERVRFTMSDNPGLLPLASENVGLGHSFLRSIERSLALVYVLDMTRASPAADLAALRHELEVYKPGLADKAMMVVLNKADEVDEHVGRARLAELTRAVEPTGETVVTVSAKYGLGMPKVVAGLAEYIERERERERARQAVVDVV
ncbi:hypothetical protein NliqN6_3654 [Naganishia liquefaciens]|uniref:Uncharacterized protein n=1 Tax=Naganishia liquefaciens TaxID=104408 RepID=A0A8H3YGI2_9TREE|nr:hypothetical protein NliqN6_3654 [Naganishia liquefaciens]